MLMCGEGNSLNIQVFSSVIIFQRLESAVRLMSRVRPDKEMTDSLICTCRLLVSLILST